MNITNKDMQINPDNLLQLDHQLCFALYVCSKEVIKKYRPLLEPLGLTYTGYITMLALWECDHDTVKELGQKLYLDSGTLTPLLKKLELQGFITRTRSLQNERNVYIDLTNKGRKLKAEAIHVPLQLMDSIACTREDSRQLLGQLHWMIGNLLE